MQWTVDRTGEKARELRLAPHHLVQGEEQYRRHVIGTPVRRTPIGAPSRGISLVGRFTRLSEEAIVLRE